MNRNLTAAIVFAFLITGCLAHRQGMYLSPLDSQSIPYHTIPFRSDSLKSAVFGSMLFSTGSANDKGKDWVHAGQASIYRSHNLGNVQAYYGGNITLGNYGVSDFYNSHYTPGQPGLIGGGDRPIDSFYHIPANKYFFGSYGVSAGINGLKTLRRMEWRFLGLELCLQKEFGNYYQFRQALPDTAANIIFKNNFTGTLGIYTESLWRNRSNTQYGLKFSLNMLLNPQSDYTKENTYGIFPISYLSTTFHMTAKRFTGFMQFNFGTKASSFQIGTSYQISK
jgi:hypothetical protein